MQNNSAKKKEDPEAIQNGPLHDYISTNPAKSDETTQTLELLDKTFKKELITCEPMMENHHVSI